MAYNPFNIFRRNQKALFAVLTVFIMIMFTLQFGPNDIFDRFTRWLGKGGRGEALCKIGGSTIKDSEVSRVRRGRIMANSFMTLASNETLDALRRYTDQQRGKLSEDGQKMATDVQMAEFSLMSPQLAGGMGGVQQAIFRARMGIQSVAENPNAKSEDKDAARAYQAQLDLIQRRLVGAEGGLFFLNAPNRTTRDAIEFMLWEKKADQIGIHFTRDDVRVLIGREFYGFFKSDVEVRKALQKQIEGFNLDTCLDALAVEFKVRAAQAAVLGPPGKLGTGAPVYGTPYEAFEYFRQQCSPAKYELLPVPAQAFIEKVPGDPSERELKELYDKYANDEPDPTKETPGFKEPRKLSVRWLALTGQEPYYQKLAAEQVKTGEAMAKASGLTTVPVPGIGGAWASAAAAPLALKEPAVDAAYADAVREFKSHLQLRYDRNFLYLPQDVLVTNVVRPATPVAALAGLMGQTAPFGSPIQTASLALGAPCGYEVQARLKAGLPALLGASPSGAALFQTLVGGSAAYRTNEPKPLPIEVLRPELMKTTLAKRARELAFGQRPDRFDPNVPVEKGDVARFTEELAKLSDKGRAKDKTAVNEYIKKFMADRGLTKEGEQFGTTTMPRDEWGLEEDPGLRPLVLAQKEGLGRAMGAHGGNRYVPFGRSFFWVTQRDQRRLPTSGTFAAAPYPPEDRSFGDENRPRYVVWVTEDVQPKKTNFITAKDAVKAAWKRAKARELAQQRAQAIADALAKDPATSAVTLNLALSEQAGRLRDDIPAGNKAYFRAHTFTLDKVCPLVPIDLSALSPEVFQQMLMQGVDLRGRLQPFGLTETENIPYPTRDMGSKLLENRNKPFKTTLVLPDAPKDTFYVAVLMQSADDPAALKTAADFKKDVYARTGPAREVLGEFIQEESRKSRQTVVDLLKKEFRYEETPEQAKKLDERSGRD